jgi:protein-arginine kinase activator protein McsA
MQNNLRCNKSVNSAKGKVSLNEERNGRRLRCEECHTKYGAFYERLGKHYCGSCFWRCNKPVNSAEGKVSHKSNDKERIPYTGFQINLQLSKIILLVKSIVRLVGIWG